jgi:4-hydroxy-3-polyprenylbenzoate decarboxylase
MRILVAISGASGVSLGLQALALLPEEMERFVVLSDHARVVFEKEQGQKAVLPAGVQVLKDSDIAAPPASGSFGLDAMLIAPCSMNTLAKIACGIADTLTTRAAAVMLKEHRKLLLAPREMPFDAIALENMLKLARLGVGIAPPVMGYYAGVDSLEKMERFVVGKWLDQLGISHDLFPRWGRDDSPDP